MARIIRFSTVTLFIILTRSYDAYSTFLYTPDLSQEANPLVSILGFQWTPLLLVLAILTCYVVYAHFMATFRPMKLSPEEKGFGFGEFIGYVYTGKRQSWTSVFYKLPNSFARFNQFMGILLTRSLVFAGIVSTVMWLLLSYTDFYPEIHTAKAIYAILVTGSAAVILHWSWKMYGIYQSEYANEI